MQKSPDDNKNMVTVSVVIPTLGGESLAGTIKQINDGTYIPSEILICIPEEEASRVEHITFPNLTVVKTACRGQVAQRAEGFTKASSRYVMQLDDDILVDAHCLEDLVRVLESRKGKCAVSPSIRFIGSNKTVYPEPSKKSIKRFYYYLINGRKGYKPGTITRAGTEIGIDPGSMTSEYIEVDWLPGGCALHARENLVLNNFYPFSGKAYCEDLYHSLSLKRKEIRMFISGKAIVWIDDPRKYKKTLKNSIKDIRLDYRARKHYLKLTSRGLFRMYLFYFLFALGIVRKSVRISDKY